jgi:hypothetical protein
MSSESGESGESGELHVSHGVHYEEHHGVMATLAFGQELLFCAGSKMTVDVGMESAFVVGAENKVGIATNSIFELGAEVKYVRGWAVEIAQEGGGAYEQAFTATAGSSTLGAFTSLKIFFGFSIFAQVASVATMLAVVKSTYVKDGELTPEGESGAKVTLSICQNITGAIMFLGTIALNAAVRKFLTNEPLSAVTVNHESEAFIGVRGPITQPGTGGLELKINEFKLSAGNINRSFKTHGHEVVGFDTNAGTQILGNQDILTLRSKQLKLTATSSKSAVLFNDDKMLAYVGGSEASPGTSLQMGNIQLSSPGSAASLQKGIRLGVSSAGTALSMSANWVRVSCNDGTMLEIQKNTQAKLSFGNSSSSVLLKQNEASLNFGTQSVKLGPTGVDIAGAITILAPAVGVPDALGKVTVSSEMLGVIADNMKNQVKSIALEQSSAAYNLAMSQISSIKRSLETKISEATTKAGSA